MLCMIRMSGFIDTRSSTKACLFLGEITNGERLFLNEIASLSIEAAGDERIVLVDFTSTISPSYIPMFCRSNLYFRLHPRQSAMSR